MAVAFGARSNMSMLTRGSRGARPPIWGLGAKPNKLRGAWQGSVFAVVLDVDGGGGSSEQFLETSQGGAGSRFCDQPKGLPPGSKIGKTWGTGTPQGSTYRLNTDDRVYGFQKNATLVLSRC